MSIETFFLTHPAKPNFAEKIGWRNYLPKSPVGFMAELLIAEGGKGIIKNGNSLAEATISGNKDSITRYSEPFYNNSASVCFGIGIRAIEGIIRTGMLDCGEINQTFAKIYEEANLPAPEMASDGKEVVGDGLIDLIARVADSDKTFAVFYEDEVFKILPQSFKDFFGIALPDIRERVLPRYKERMDLLVEINSHRRR